eukprot:SM000016S01868  [mRNA]  locus=s16:333224:335708:+ [translate_table: standard]
MSRQDFYSSLIMHHFVVSAGVGGHRTVQSYGSGCHQDLLTAWIKCPHSTSIFFAAYPLSFDHICGLCYLDGLSFQNVALIAYACQTLDATDVAKKARGLQSNGGENLQRPPEDVSVSEPSAGLQNDQPEIGLENRRNSSEMEANMMVIKEKIERFNEEIITILEAGKRFFAEAAQSFEGNLVQAWTLQMRRCGAGWALLRATSPAIDGLEILIFLYFRDKEVLLLVRRGGLGLQPGLNGLVLRVEVGHIHNQARPLEPLMFMAQEPQMPSRQERRNVSPGSCSFLILSSTSSIMGPQSFTSTVYVCMRGLSLWSGSQR